MSVVPIRPGMLAAVMGDAEAVRPRPAFSPADSGYRLVYHRGEVNHCPGCGRCNWWLRNSTAECAFCATALPLKG